MIRSTRALAVIALMAAILGTACAGGAHEAVGGDRRPEATTSASGSSSAAPRSESSSATSPPTSSTTTLALGTRAEQSAGTTTPAPPTQPDAAPAPTPDPGGPVDSTPAVAAPGARFVTAYGVRLTVPADWPVYDLAADARRCVRTDRHAVYLGHAGADQQCPTQVVGRVETVQIEPLDAQTPPDVGLATASSDLNGVAVQLDPASDTTHAVVAVVPTDRVAVTITFETDRGLAEQILQSLEHVANPTRRHRRPSPGSTGVVRGVGLPGKSGGRLHRARVRCVRRADHEPDVRVARVAVPQHRDLHRRREPRLQPAQPHGLVGEHGARPRLEARPDLRRAPGAVRLDQRGEDRSGDGRRARRGSGGGRDEPRLRAGDRRAAAADPRHGGLQQLRQPAASRRCVRS